MKLDAIYFSPVKSLALQRLERALVTRHGIAGDRRFFIVDAADRVFTQRECGPLVRVRAAYTLEPESLRIDLPDGTVAQAPVVHGETIAGSFYGREFPGVRAPGPWDAALSDYAGQPLRLARAPTGAFDGLPIAICSTASVEEVRRRATGAAVDERRFRPNLYVSGIPAHGEDAWLGQRFRVGASAVIHVRMRDPRCAITTHDPDTGEIDVNTLKIIAGYRRDQPKEVNFGVYATVDPEGLVAVGDEIVPVGDELSVSSDDAPRTATG